MKLTDVVVCCILSGLLGPRLTWGGSSVADEIRAEALRPNQGESGRPLPLVSHWNTGVHAVAAGWGPPRQVELIEQGHHLLPWFQLPIDDASLDPAAGTISDDHLAALERLRAMNLPITFISTQWDLLFSREPYVNLPPDENPNVVATDGQVLKEADPFGPIGPWTQVGRRWTENEAMKQMQALYPDPPKVFFLSNNEYPRLRWTEAEKSQRYIQRFGPGRDDEFKRRVIAEGFIERYRALQQGMRDGLVQEPWKTPARFIAYEAFGPAHLGRWPGWKEYSLHVPGRIDPGPLMWDGASTSYYTHDWNPITDHTVWSPQVEFMNHVFQLREAERLNPDFWYELSIWDGSFSPRRPGDKRQYYANLGQSYTPRRYAGFVQFGMWLLRPRVVREFRIHTHPWEEGEPYFMALVESVDRVYTNPTLRDWWRHGELVPNRARKHPYQTDILPEYADEDRWFLLDADCNPRESVWESFWDVPVFALALTRGGAADRQWLVYAHAPLGDRDDVTLAIPQFGDVTVDVAVGGSFYLVDRQTRSVTAVISEPTAAIPLSLGSAAR